MQRRELDREEESGEEMKLGEEWKREGSGRWERVLRLRFPAGVSLVEVFDAEQPKSLECARTGFRDWNAQLLLRGVRLAGSEGADEAESGVALKLIGRCSSCWWKQLVRRGWQLQAPIGG